MTIGGASAGAGTFTSLNATGGGSLTGTWTNLGTVTTVDINGGTVDGVTIGGASAGAGTFTTLSDQDGDVRILPAEGAAKTTSYVLTTDDVGQVVLVGAGGAITVPDSTFSQGDIITMINTTGSSVTITCSITDCYVNGSDVSSTTLSPRGICTVWFNSGTECYIAGDLF